MTRARSRAGENGPLMTLFNAAASAKYWVENGHRFAVKTDDKMSSKTVTRIWKEEKLQYTSKILRF